MSILIVLSALELFYFQHDIVFVESGMREMDCINCILPLNNTNKNIIISSILHFKGFIVPFASNTFAMSEHQLILYTVRMHCMWAVAFPLNRRKKNDNNKILIKPTPFQTWHVAIYEMRNCMSFDFVCMIRNISIALHFLNGIFI